MSQPDWIPPSADLPVEAQERIDDALSAMFETIVSAGVPAALLDVVDGLEASVSDGHRAEAAEG
jgi:hypothetical protein